MPRGLKAEKSHGWKGNDAGVDAGRVRARNLYNLGPCERCGEPATDRHHVDGNTLNNEPDNVQIFCRRCHMIVDGRIELLPTVGVPRKPAEISICVDCGVEYRPLRKGRCIRCAAYFYRHGSPRPLNIPKITHCPRGHEYTSANTRIDKKGCKNCRACRAEDERKRRRLAKAIIDGQTEDPKGN